MQIISDKDVIKKKIMSNSLVLALKENLKKKILKQQSKDFKANIQNFLQNPSTNY